MSRTERLSSSVPWTGVVSTEQDWNDASPGRLTTMFSQLTMIRAFEEYALELGKAGLIHGPLHSSIGQEAGAVGSVLALGDGDTINGSHRGHHQFIAKVLAHLAPDFDLATDVTDEVRAALLRTLAEICGLKRGFSGGRGGSMHLQWIDAGAIGTNAIVGGGVPIAAGSGWAHRAAGTDRVSITYFGDGAVNIGSTLETFNLAAAWGIPVCFFIENNQYAVSTHVSEATGEPRLSGRGQGFGIPSWKVDGMDVLAVHSAMQAAVEHMRDGGGPTIVEADVYRYFHQNGPFPGSAFGYRTKEEEATWRDRDPIVQIRGHLTRRGIADETRLDAMEQRARDLMDDIGAVLLEPVPGGRQDQRRIKDEEWPDSDFVDVGVRGDLREFDDAGYAEEHEFSGTMKQTKLVAAIAAVIGRRMEADDRVVVLGEDVHHLNGGTNGATRGLTDRFPGRVLGTPISENAFAGLGGGIALDGRFTPIVEFMYADFMWVAADQLFNQIAKARHMFGGTQPVPFVLRSKVATGSGYGSQHSMDPAGILVTAPGLRIVAPTTPFDYVGLMNAALRCQDPVVVLEHVDLYAVTGPVPTDDLDYCTPVGKAAVRRHGNGVTVLSYLGMVKSALEAAEQVPEAEAEVIDLRWLDRASLDWDTITDSVRRTNRVLIVEQGAVGTSYGSWLADEIGRRLFDWLDVPVQRVTGGEASPSISKVLERAAIAGTPEVVAALTTIAKE